VRERRLLENRNWRGNSLDLDLTDRLARVIFLPSRFFPQGIGQYNICCATDRRGEFHVILWRSAWSIEGKIEANHARARSRQPFDELSVQITRPLAWFAWQAQLLSGLLVDRDNDDVRGRLSGAPKMEQPLQLEVLLDFRHAREGSRQASEQSDH
jgi:hypothetical protein